MNERTFRLLEYDKIQGMLAEETSNSLGRDMALQWMPAADIETAQKLQEETEESRRALDSGASPRLGNIFPLRESLMRAKLGGILNGEELCRISATCSTAVSVKKYFKENNYPTLKKYADLLGDFESLLKKIRKAVGDEGEILDGASEKLASLRRQGRSIQNRIREKLEHMIRGSAWQKYLQESIYTVRGDRYVLPVKQEYRHMVPGVVHDISGSGATLFVEPMAVVELSNELKQCEAQIQEEIEAILKILTALVREEAEGIQTSLETLAMLDLIFARAMLSIKLKATRPLLNGEGWLDIRKARHPLLKGRVVPIDVTLGKEFHVLVITGPNTGGKTVTLKTVGLFVLMAQAGLQVPAAHGTELCIFHGLYCDLGDEQSIEQSLSTFSGHIKNIVSLIGEAADQGSLVLLDELGAGTDPLEGAALAMALLDFFHGKGIRVIATTHYSELKSFAYNRPGFANASMEFDLSTLSPTFHLLMGLPGHSNALVIAERLGMPGAIIRKAQDFLSHEAVKVEDILEDLAREQKIGRENREKAEEITAEARSLKEHYQRELEKLRQEREQILIKAREEASRHVKEAREEAEEIVRELRDEAKNKELSDRTYRMRERFRRKLEEIGEDAGKEIEKSGEAIDPAKLKPGLQVKSRRLGITGSVLETDPGKREALVQFGVVKTAIRFDDLSEAAEAGGKGAGGRNIFPADKGETISPELHLRGLTVEEALEITDKYLDDACLAGLHTVRIVHGKGTGTLRREISAFLKKHPRVKNIRLGDISEGGLGVTIAELE